VSRIHPAVAPRGALLLPFPRPGNGPTQSRPIPREGFVLGRGAAVFDQPFGDPAMSDRHAEVRLHGARVVVHDLGSAAGTRVNGEPVREPRSLIEGDVLRLGDTVLVFTNREWTGPTTEQRTPLAPELTGTTPSIEAVRSPRTRARS
jgi:S-DNA-T family DNA segregation ATPase FtsK/SpoIIIE